jgi:hypothetical protein
VRIFIQWHNSCAYCRVVALRLLEPIVRQTTARAPVVQLKMAVAIEWGPDLRRSPCILDEMPQLNTGAIRAPPARRET